MGLGKLTVQTFLEFSNVHRAVGVELCGSRFAKALVAFERLAELEPFASRGRLFADVGHRRVCLQVPRDTVSQSARIRLASGTRLAVWSN